MSASDSFSDLVLNAIPHAVVVVEEDNRILFANLAAESFFGASAATLRRQKLNDLVPGSSPVLALLDQARSLGAPLSEYEVDLGTPKSGAHITDVQIAPLGEGDARCLVHLQERSMAQKMDRQLVHRGAARSVSAMSAILAHEIKNPLAGIRGAAQLLGRKLEGGDLALTTLIADEVDRIAKLIDQMQTLSRRTPQELAPCNLHEAVRRARAVMEASGKAPPIAEEFDPSLPPVMGNAGALVQVVINLLANAADACAGVDKPRIVVRTRFASGLQLHRGADGTPVRLPIELRVSDNGPGVDPAMRDHVFEPFVTTKKSGQGLGLALVRRLVRDMNGRIGHDRDEAGGWTHFRLHLPLAAEARGRRREAGDRAEPGGGAGPRAGDGK